MVNPIVKAASIGLGLAGLGVAGLMVNQALAQNPAPTQSAARSIAQVQPSAQTTAQTTAQILAQTAPIGRPQALRTTDVTTTINRYELDDNCQGFVAKKTPIGKKQSLETAVGSVIESFNSADFELSGYRVSRAGRVATIDLRVPPDSKRGLASLSYCEQQSLFGSLRRTLIQNGQLAIGQVRFTSQGKPVKL
jgi:hypothetical protein